MDIIGKIYKDFFCNIDQLDGNSHLLKNHDLGGVYNLLENWNILSKDLKDISFHFFLISDFKNQIEEKTNIQILNSSENCPKALIFDFDGKRTSFVLDDFPINIPKFEQKSDFLLIYYGDKLIPNKNLTYKKIFIDTAGNNYDDLLSLAKFNYPEESLVSISSELLNEELINLYVNKKNYIILSHSPKETIVISKDYSKKIINAFYRSFDNNKKAINVTGLGDKFTFLVAFNFSYLGIDLFQSIKRSQELLSKIIFKT